MERVGSKQAYEGEMVTLRIDSFRYPDGSVREREIVAHPGAVAIVAHDDELLFMVRQPREAVGEDALLELPAGKLDVEGETPLDCAKRELEEEVGLRAREWRELKRFYSSPGFTDEEVHVFEATGPGAGRAGSRGGRADRDSRGADVGARPHDRQLRRREVADRAAAAPQCAESTVAAQGMGRSGENLAAWRSPSARRFRSRQPREVGERFEGLVLDFLSYLELERGLSRNTLNAYRTDLLQYGEFLSARKGDALAARPADIAEFLAELATGNGRPPCAAATIHRKAACLRSFYKHLRREELIDEDPTAAPQRPATDEEASPGAELRRGAAAAGGAARRRARRCCATGRCSR